VAIACWWSPYNQPEFWLLREPPRGRMAVSQPLDPGKAGPRVRPYPVRPTPWAYDGVPGEGSIRFLSLRHASLRLGPGVRVLLRLDSCGAGDVGPALYLAGEEGLEGRRIGRHWLDRHCRDAPPRIVERHAFRNGVIKCVDDRRRRAASHEHALPRLHLEVVAVAELADRGHIGEPRLVQNRSGACDANP
jgi:hypothetical protein